MAGFVKEVMARSDALAHVAGTLRLPWDNRGCEVPLNESVGLRMASCLVSDMKYPEYTRSLRDGYAVQSEDVAAATPGTPTFLRKRGEVTMGHVPDFTVLKGETAPIPTGGVLPCGADAVVMLEDTCAAGDWIEVRRGVQAGENVMLEGEEIKVGDKLMERGEMIDFRSVSLLATLGVKNVFTASPRINILSTGDEVVPVETRHIPPGCVRDANGVSVCAMLRRYGFVSQYRGIISDDADAFEKKIEDELARCDVLILSGGSSVGVRDQCSLVLEKLPPPGLLVRGINMVPGKPVLIAGCVEEKKLVISLPGHPLSCLTATYVVAIPLLLRLIGAENEMHCGKIFLELAQDLPAKSGPEEFTPCHIDREGKLFPLRAKSGYVFGLASADGFIRIPENCETMRAGEIAEVWIW